LSFFVTQGTRAGIRTAVDELDGSHIAYGYDSLYRLTSEVRTGAHAYIITYEYDDVGNRQTQVKDGATTTYMYNNRDQLINESGSGWLTTYTYDHAGRMTSKTDTAGTTIYSWIDNDRMTSVSGPGVLTTYDYDHNGQRVTETAGSSTKKYLIDYQLPYGQVIAEMDGSGSLVASYVFGQDRISMTRGAGTHTYVADGQGSIRQLTNGAGLVTDEYFYTAFGVQLARTGTTVNPFQYVGEAFDPNAGFYYNRARWYDPANGRFTSVDPIFGIPQAPVSLHKYLYAGSSPISFKDPTGKFTLVDLCITIAICDILSRTYYPLLARLTDFTTNSAYFAKRPLMALISSGLSVLGYLSQLVEESDIYNVEMMHEQIFFNDGKEPSNLGYIGDRIQSDDPEHFKYYQKSAIGYNAIRLRKAVAKVESRGVPQWTLIYYNCQDFAADVRREYLITGK
jgi:RHS repeat-associated protein